MQKTRRNPISTICWNRESSRRHFSAVQKSSRLCETWPAVAASLRVRERPSNREPRRPLPVNFWGSTRARRKRSGGREASARKWHPPRRGTCSSEGWTRSRGLDSRSVKFKFESVLIYALNKVFILSCQFNLVTFCLIPKTFKNLNSKIAPN